MKKKPSKTRTQKFQTIVLSILLAIIVWLLVIYVNDPNITTTISDLNIRFVGEAPLREKKLAITGKNNIHPLSVTVTGKRSDLINFMEHIYVEVDVSNISDIGEYKLTGTISIPTTRITVEKENYSEIPVAVEPLTTKDITVSVKQTGTIRNKLVQSVISDPKVTITGAKSEIDNVSGAVATVDISNLHEDKTERVSYLLTDASDNLINSNETLESTRSYVDISHTIYDEKTLPVIAVLSAELDNDYILQNDKTVVTPSTVTVGVTPDNTSDLLIARITKIDNDTVTSCALENPSGMYIPPDSREIKVKTELIKKAVAQMELEVHIENLPDGLSAHTTENLSASVWGEEGKLTPENIYASVDASELEKGEHTLPVTLRGNHAGFIGEYTINVIVE